MQIVPEQINAVLTLQRDCESQGEDNLGAEERGRVLGDGETKVLLLQHLKIPFYSFPTPSTPQLSQHVARESFSVLPRAQRAWIPPDSRWRGHSPAAAPGQRGAGRAGGRSAGRAGKQRSHTRRPAASARPPAAPR